MSTERKPKSPSSYKAPNRETFVKGKLRQASLKWKPRNEAMKRARVDRGLYRCAHCKKDFKSERVHLDHIEPVVDIKSGWTNWDDFINRLFCDVEGFQVLCENCHDAKTRLEDEMRTFYSNKRREARKKKK